MNKKTKTFPHVKEYDIVIKNNKNWIVQYIDINGVGKISSYEDPPELDGLIIDLEEPYEKYNKDIFKKEKNNFSYKEVVFLIKKAYIEGGKSTLNFERNFDLEEWINEKLKK